jgi:GDSL-like Lipase/Acylhydrolase family
MRSLWCVARGSRSRFSAGTTPAASLLVAATLVSALALQAIALAKDSRGKDYLALGDSVAFGYSPLVDPSNPDHFIGYPSTVDQLADENITNASCPGETSGGFILPTGADNGCRLFRTFFPLHVAYSGTQLDFATSFLLSHPRTRLVTIDIGADDLRLLQQQCLDQIPCIEAGLPDLLSTLSANLDTIYGSIRNTAHYRHRLVALTYYALDYRDLVRDAILAALNSVIVDRTHAWGGVVADGFGAFAVASNFGDSCTAGLLIPLPSGGCDIHPSPLGRDLLAHAIAAVLNAK